jgi:NADH-quinone oxidoreductase subunit N
MTDPFTYLPTTADWLRILPELVLLGAIMLVLGADLVLPQKRKGWLAFVSLLGVLAAGVTVGAMFVLGDARTAFAGMITSDWTALLADAIILFAVGLGLLFSPAYLARYGVVHVGEYFALLLLAALGMMLMASATNLMVVFVGLEVLSLALYILCALLPNHERSQEAGMKYFLLSSFASAFLLYGMALTYGSTGATDLARIRAFLDPSVHPLSLTGGYGPLLLAALALMAVGLAFKVAAIPFQAWTPDVYVGAPTPVTAFMSVGTKVAAFVALARVFLFALRPVADQWQPVFWVLAVLTIVGGNVLALTQRDVKRMLAYSSIANAGYMLIAVAVGTRDALAALLIYLATYAVMNVGAFGVVLALERGDGSGTTLDDYTGLSRRRPWIAACMAVFLFALAGVPALAGFVGKWYIFRAAVLGNHIELAIIGALASVVGMYYYLRVVWAMYFSDVREVMAADRQGLTPTPEALAPLAHGATLAAGTAGGAVAVAEPASSSPPTGAAGRAPTPVGRGRRTKEHPTPAAEPNVTAPLPLGVWVGLALAALGTFALGIVPMLITRLADAAAAALLH